MKTFLQTVAQDLYSKIGSDLSRTAIVFPNKRASLFSTNTWQRRATVRCGHPLTLTSANCSANFHR